MKDGQPNPTFLTVPTDAEKQGNFSALLPLGSQYQLYDPGSAVLSGTTVTRTPFPGNIIPQNELNPIALQLHEVLSRAERHRGRGRHRHE